MQETSEVVILVSYLLSAECLLFCKIVSVSPKGCIDIRNRSGLVKSVNASFVMCEWIDSVLLLLSSRASRAKSSASLSSLWHRLAMPWYHLVCSYIVQKDSHGYDSATIFQNMMRMSLRLAVLWEMILSRVGRLPQMIVSWGLCCIQTPLLSDPTALYFTSVLKILLVDLQVFFMMYFFYIRKWTGSLFAYIYLKSDKISG